MRLTKSVIYFANFFRNPLPHSCVDSNNDSRAATTKRPFKLDGKYESREFKQI